MTDSTIQLEYPGKGQGHTGGADVDICLSEVKRTGTVSGLSSLTGSGFGT